MKLKLFLLTVLIVSSFVACNQSKKTTEDEPEVKTEDVKKADELKPVIAKGVLINAENDEPISMAMVIVAGTQTGSVTNADGKFQIEAPGGAKKLFFSAKGYESLKVDIDKENEMIVKLKPKTK